jgi:hypothetical protein
MTKLLIDEAVVRQALEALEQIANAMPFPVGRLTITALRQALEQHVANIDTSPERVEKEAENKDVRPQNCGTGYCSCIECLYEQPAPAQPLSDGWYVMQIDGGTKKIWPMTEDQALAVALHGITKCGAA